MTTVTNRKPGSFYRHERRQSLLGGLAIGFELLSRLKGRSCSSPRRLSAGFGLRFAPSQTQQKSRRQPADGSRRQFAATPPTRKLLALGLCQRAQGPQKPEGRRNHLNPDLNAPFSFGAVELSTGQSQIAFHKSDAVFNTESFFVNRLSLARRRQFDLERCGHEDQPQRALVTRLAIGLILDDAVEREPLRRPLSHPYIIPTADLNASAVFEFPHIFGVNLWQRSLVVESDLSPAHPRTPEPRIRRRRQEENTIAGYAPKNWDAQLVNRIEKRFDCVLRIYGQRLPFRPTMSLDELIQLRDPVSNRIGYGRDPADLQWQCPTSFTDAFREQRQAVAQVHSRSAVHIAQLDGLSLGAWVISRIQNPDAPFARRRIDRNDLLRSEPSQALFAQFLEPVIIGNRFGQFPARPIDAGVKTAPPIAPQGTERHFSGRDRAWPGCQDINQIDQDPARRPKSLRDVVTKIFYTRLRGAVCFFCHAPSVTLDARLVGEAWPPRFLTKLVKVEVLQKSSDQDIALEDIKFQADRDNWVPAIVAKPRAGAQPLPAIICLPGTNGTRRHLVDPILQLSQFPRTGWARALAGQGYITLSLDYRGSPAREQNIYTEAVRTQLEGNSYMGLLVHEVMRAVDYLQTRPDVDRTRIGITGFSLGWAMSWYAAAADERLSVVVPVCGGVGTYQALTGDQKKTSYHSQYFYPARFLKLFPGDQPE